MGKIVQFLPFFVWVTPFNMILSRLIHLPAKLMVSIFVIPEQYSKGYVYHISITHFSVEGHLGCLPFVATVSRAAMKMGEQISVE